MLVGKRGIGMQSGKDLYEAIINLFKDSNIEEVYIIDDGIVRTFDGTRNYETKLRLDNSEVLAFVDYFLNVVRSYRPGLNVDLNKEFSVPCKINVFGKEKMIEFSAVLSEKLIVFPQFNIRVDKLKTLPAI